MQGGNAGSRPFTSVFNDAEMAKFDRNALSFLTTMPASGNRTPRQYIDYDAFSSSWNADVELEEQQARKGLVVLQTHNLVNRKHPHALKHHMNTSKKTINAKRTMEPFKDQVQHLRKNQRVDAPPQWTPGSDRRPRTGVLQGGEEITFPLVAEANRRPRPIPVLVSSASPGTGGGDGTESACRMDTMTGSGSGDGPRGPEGAVSGVALQAGLGRTGRDNIGDGAHGVVGGVSTFGGRSGVGQDVGSVGGSVVVPSSGGSIPGAPCFVPPVQACSTLRTIAPKFGPVQALLEPWNPTQQLQPSVVGVAPPAPKQRAKRSCQDCGHLYTTGYYAAAIYHTRLAGKYTCLVKARFPDRVRQPDFPARGRNLFKTCTCALCTSPA
jgi:hypothetical protein